MRIGYRYEKKITVNEENYFWKVMYQLNSHYKCLVLFFVKFKIYSFVKKYFFYVKYE